MRSGFWEVKELLDGISFTLTSNTKLGVGWGESIITLLALDSETMEVGSREMSLKSLIHYHQSPRPQHHTKISQYTDK